MSNIFYIARHGQTENNKAKRLSGWIDTPLTTDGLVPTKTVIKKLRQIPFDQIYSSDSGRAFITAYDIARGLDFTGEIIRLAGLREVNYGDAANMKSIDAYEQYPLLDRGTHFTPPNGESLHHMQERVVATLAKLNGEYTGATILIVAHSGVMAALKSSFTGQDFGAHNISEAYAHDFVASFTIADGKIVSFEPIVTDK